MRTDTLPLSPGTETSQYAAPEPAFDARTRLARLRDALVAARGPRPAARWGEPSVFFFDPVRQAEFDAACPKAATAGPHPLAAHIAAELPDLFRSADVRRVARAVRGLREAAVALAPRFAEAKDLADLLAVPDDEAVLVLHPGLRAGYRLLVSGVADVHQFHVLMLDALPGAPAPLRVVAAYRDAEAYSPADVPVVAEVRFQLFKPTALRADGTVPGGFRGCAHWLWGGETLATVPRVDGERVVLLGEPAYRETWEVERRFPALPAAVRLLQTLSPLQVAERLGRIAGRPIPERVAAEPELAKAA